MNTAPRFSYAIPVVRTPLPCWPGGIPPVTDGQAIMQIKELVPDTERYKEWLAWVKPEQWVRGNEQPRPA